MILGQKRCFGLCLASPLSLDNWRNFKGIRVQGANGTIPNPNQPYIWNHGSVLLIATYELQINQLSAAWSSASSHYRQSNKILSWNARFPLPAPPYPPQPPPHSPYLSHPSHPPLTTPPAVGILVLRQHALHHRRVPRRSRGHQLRSEALHRALQHDEDLRRLACRSKLLRFHDAAGLPQDPRLKVNNF